MRVDGLSSEFSRPPDHYELAFNEEVILSLLSFLSPIFTFSLAKLNSTPIASDIKLSVSQLLIVIIN